ncbi:MAG: HYExAFE family protein [Planctomycetes bacterium]|nr:HYExAFE family protein [Planctomycetota bacterium]
MANRDNHYEAAFEAYLRRRRLPYVAVDETRRSLVANGSIKSLDFIVSPPGRLSWLVDVKGRRFPSGDEHHQYWRNWSTRDDLSSLAAWQQHFGPGFCSLLVFAYHVVADRSPLPLEQLFEFRGRQYGLLGVRLADYVPYARPLSDSWDTVAMPVALFRRVARPLDELFSDTRAVAAAADWQIVPTGLEWES